MPPRALRRVGLLSAVPESDGVDAAVAIGDVAARHVRLTPAGITPYLADAPAGFVPWNEVAGVDVEPPVTWWPHPVLGDTIPAMLEGLFGGGAVEAVETPSFPVRVAVREGAARTDALPEGAGRTDALPEGAGRTDAAPGGPARAGNVLEWRAASHHLSGYRRRDAALARKLLAHLTARADARILLARPSEMLGRLAEILRAT